MKAISIPVFKGHTTVVVFPWNFEEANAKVCLNLISDLLSFFPRIWVLCIFCTMMRSFQRWLKNICYFNSKLHMSIVWFQAMLRKQIRQQCCTIHLCLNIWSCLRTFKVIQRFVHIFLYKLMITLIIFLVEAISFLC